jgi:hypothetical protein
LSTHVNPEVAPLIVTVEPEADVVIPPDPTILIVLLEATANPV